MGNDVKSNSAILHALHGLAKHEGMQSGFQRRRTVTSNLNTAALLQKLSLKTHPHIINHLPRVYKYFKVINVTFGEYLLLWKP